MRCPPERCFSWPQPRSRTREAHPNVPGDSIVAHVAHVEHVAHGETIEVTDHGRVIARIIPAQQESVIERLVAEGLIELPTDPSRELPGRIHARGIVSDLIADQRR